MRASKILHADVGPETVTSFLVDQSVTPPGMTIEAVNESPAIVGNLYEWTFKMLGLPRKGVTVATEYVRGERVAFRSFGAMEGSSTWTVEPEDGGSRATVELDSRLVPIPAVDRLLDPILQPSRGRALPSGSPVMTRAVFSRRMAIQSSGKDASGRPPRRANEPTSGDGSRAGPQPTPRYG